MEKSADQTILDFFMDLFDTHFHLPEDGETGNYLDALYSEHSYRMLALGGSQEGSLRALAFARKHDNVARTCSIKCL